MHAFTLLTLIGFFLFLSRGITGPVSSLYAESLGASYVAIGMLGTASSFTAVAANTFWGGFLDRLARRKAILVLGLVLLAAGDVLIALAPDYRFLYAWYVLNAVAQAAYGTASLALMGDLLDDRAKARGRRVGAYRGLGSLGFGLMALNAGFIADRLSLRAPFGIAGGLVLAGALIALLIKEPSQPGGRPLAAELWAALVAMPGTLSRSLRQRVTRLRIPRPTIGTRTRQTAESSVAHLLPLAPLLVASFLWSLSMGAVYSVWANYMVTEIGYTPTVMSRLWALASLSEFPLMILAGWLSDRTGRLPMLCLGFIAWAMVFTGYIVAPVMPWILGVQLVRGFAFSAFTIAAMAYATEVRGQEQRGRVAGLFGSAGGLGAILGGATGGTLTQWLGFRPMLAVNVTLVLAGAVYIGIAALRLHLRMRGAHAQVPGSGA
jgi:MFS family permease